MFELPLIEPRGPKERADAARNRMRILEAAGASVGTGTLYRRFGDRAGLAFALLDEQTREFQNALISGPPPLGPGAPAVERLKAFGEGYLDLLETHSSLMVAAAPGGKEADGPYSLYTTHLVILLREAAPQLDAQFTAEALLATLAPAHHLRVRGGLGWPLERMRAGWKGLVEAIST
jgi:AcrR family transcriptional regulator